MKRLEERVELSKASLGEGDCVATLIKREGNIAMYLRGIGIYEVFIVQEQKPSVAIMKGKEVIFEHKELYPNDESFGVTAWCYTDLSRAELRYNQLLTLSA